MLVVKKLIKRFKFLIFEIVFSEMIIVGDFFFFGDMWLDIKKFVDMCICVLIYLFLMGKMFG